MISLFRGLRHAEAEVAPGRGQPETWGRRVLGRNCAGWGGAWDRWVQGAVVRGGSGAGEGGPTRRAAGGWWARGNARAADVVSGRRPVPLPSSARGGRPVPVGSA